MNFIDLDNSYIYLNDSRKDNCWRLAIKSILLDVKENTYYYLTKECMAELIGNKPFDHKAKSEFCAVVDSDKNTYCFRDTPVLFNEFDPLIFEEKKNFVDGIFIKNREYKKINFLSVNKKLKQRNLESLYNKFFYKYQNKEFIIFTKVEYLNFDFKKNTRKEYLQPIYGYVPFLKHNKIFISYVVSYLEKESKNYLEFRLRTIEKINKYLPLSKNFFKKIIKKFLFFCSPRIKVSGFYEKISLEESKTEFYE